MQSTALALMSCENAIFLRLHPGEVVPHPEVPIYDAIIFCDLGAEPPWVYRQASFIKRACQRAGIFFHTIKTNLYQDYMENFGRRRAVSIPFWTINLDGTKAKLRRMCTIDYKILRVQEFVRLALLGYRPYQHMKQEDVGQHEMHMGFSSEERNRCRESQNKMFKNKYPLVEMKLKRPDNYKYILETWGLDSKASSCIFCPFHRNYFYRYLKEHYYDYYTKLVKFDQMIEDRQPSSAIKSKIYISRSRKRITELCPEECNDKETFDYNGTSIWNGF